MKAPPIRTIAVLVPALIAGMVSAGMASAQTTAPATPPNQPKPEKIEVTGSLIKRVDTETPSVVQIITAKQIKESGYATIEELMRSL
ncbi:MAG: hypothetical protein JNM76_18840, partial [Betaproteobacteria bacterium]|nr:hypothetical protein [Betaproteobacteria bacterium]